MMLRFAKKWASTFQISKHTNNEQIFRNAHLPASQTISRIRLGGQKVLLWVWNWDQSGNNCYNCLAWQKTIWRDVSWVWLGQIGIGVKMICWAKTSYKTVTNTKNRSGDDDSFFQEKRRTYVSTFQISKRTKNAWAWGVMFPFSKKVVCST